MKVFFGSSRIFAGGVFSGLTGLSAGRVLIGDPGACGGLRTPIANGVGTQFLH